MLTVIDNYDSFTFNLVQAFGEFGEELRVWRNDERTVSEIMDEKPDAVIISPGPCSPNEAGISVELIQEIKNRAYQGEEIPLFGVCLGHQALADAFGGKIVRAPEIVHGKISPIFHDGRGLFQGLRQGFSAGRYHSLTIEPASLNPELYITAQTENGLIMGIQHRQFPFFGVQFHPESVLTPDGMSILRAFLQVVQENKKSMRMN